LPRNQHCFRCHRHLAGHAIENHSKEHAADDLAHPAELLAKEIGRRADLVSNLLEGLRGDSDGQQITSIAPRDDPHFEEVKERLRQCIELWKVLNTDGNSIEKEDALNEEARAAEEQICDGGFNPGSPVVAAAKLIIAKGTALNTELKRVREERLEYEAALGGLEWFGLRELYDEYFPR
jgi:hypothetical protein